MPVQGLVKLRKHQFGWQGTAMNTAVPAQRAYPFSGVPSVDEQWTDPEIDAAQSILSPRRIASPAITRHPWMTRR